MNISVRKVDAPRAVNLWFDRGKLHVALEDGREIGCPLAMFPRLAAASPPERSVWELTGMGEGIHWPSLDEDLSVRGLLEGRSVANPEPSVLAVRGAYLLAARRAARLTQAELAQAMGRSQALVSLTERGLVWTGEPYRLEVLRACRLGVRWKPAVKV